MSDDLIRRNDAIDELMHIIPYKRYHNGEYILLLNKKECLAAIKATPSIDIVFCKECISADEKPIADGRYWCNIHGCYMRFCSDGERENE